jgi:hypothetical protein
MIILVCPIFLMGGGKSGPPPQRLCIQMSNVNCPNALGSILSLEHEEYSPEIWVCPAGDYQHEDYTIVSTHILGNRPLPGSTIPNIHDNAFLPLLSPKRRRKRGTVFSSATSLKPVVKVISGYRKNPWWKRDSKHTYTYAELILKRYNRLPYPGEVESMTELTARDLFNDIHSPTRDVSVYENRVGIYCFDHNDGRELVLKGMIEFPNGERCKLKRKSYPASQTFNTNPRKIKMYVERPCFACGEDD